MGQGDGRDIQLLPVNEMQQQIERSRKNGQVNAVRAGRSGDLQGYLLSTRF
jgi:hypothetical protein